MVKAVIGTHQELSMDTTQPAQVLETILASTRRHVDSARRVMSESRLRELTESRERHDFAAALRRSALRPGIIAEIKKASPSRGLLRHDFDVSAIAQGYERAGAAALSVLTEEDHFLGSLEHLKMARAATRLPILRKDFIVSSYQIWEAVAYGADAVLLIVAALTNAELRELLEVCEAARVSALVEVHDEGELQRALAAGAKIIGVNNRDLRTFEVDRRRCLELAPRIPQGLIRVAESGFAQPADLTEAARAGYDAVLIGETFMRADDPAAALARISRAQHKIATGFVKICGITREDDALHAVDCGASAIGFIFAESRRAISVGDAAAIIRQLPPNVLPVGVFVDAPVEHMLEVARRTGIRGLQLHGDESPDIAPALAGYTIVKTRHFGSSRENNGAPPERGSSWDGHVHAFLLDTATGSQRGGTGRTFDWTRAAELSKVEDFAFKISQVEDFAPKLSKVTDFASKLSQVTDFAPLTSTPLIVAGGLTPQNVGEAIRATGAVGVDVSSGVESAVGRKDPQLVRTFIAAARAAFERALVQV